jgi:hypothetical protein
LGFLYGFLKPWGRGFGFFKFSSFLLYGGEKCKRLREFEEYCRRVHEFEENCKRFREFEEIENTR